MWVLLCIAQTFHVRMQGARPAVCCTPVLHLQSEQDRLTLPGGAVPQYSSCYSSCYSTERLAPACLPRSVFVIAVARQPTWAEMLGRGTVGE